MFKDLLQNQPCNFYQTWYKTVRQREFKFIHDGGKSPQRGENIMKMGWHLKIFQIFRTTEAEKKSSIKFSMKAT
jgi:hypothetical protein